MACKYASEFALRCVRDTPISIQGVAWVFLVDVQVDACTLEESVDVRKLYKYNVSRTLLFMLASLCWVLCVLCNDWARRRQ